jgi:EpsI family protein
MPKRTGVVSVLTKGGLLAAGLVLLGQAAILRQLSVREVNIRVPALDKLPRELGPWQVSSEQTLDQPVLDFLRPDGYILRDYSNPSRSASMNVFVAFFKSLQNTAGPHSPHDCLPGAGWLITSSAVPTFQAPGWNEQLQVNQYTMEKGGEQILVMYWYQNNRHVWAQEFKAKLTLLPDLIRYRRSDVSLVRLVTPLEQGGMDKASATARDFINHVFPSLVKTFQETD